MSKLRSTAHIVSIGSRCTNPESAACVPEVETHAKPVDGVTGWLSSTELSARVWKATCLLILIAAAVLRLYHLSLKPLHHDEGVNGYFLARLFRHGFYQYDPMNYHGPTLYYIALLVSSFLEFFSGPNELSTFAIRSVPALFGIATVALLLSLRRYVGRVGAAAAAALVAVSPGAVYFSRDFIHETLLVFFTVAIVVALLHYRDTLKVSYLMLASAAAALMFATKETAAISALVLLLALLVALFCSRGDVHVISNPEKLKVENSTCLTRRGGLGRVFSHWLLAIVIFFVLYVLLYSSFLTDPKGIYHGVETFRYWVNTGSQQHRAPWYRYLEWMSQAELPILALGTVGMVLALWHRRERFALFAGFWGWGLLAAYSLLSYKTPWLILNYLVPLAISAGYTVQLAWKRVRCLANHRATQLACAIFVLILAASLKQSITLNFFRYDDARFAYVYMQTHREFLSMVGEINAAAARSSSGRQTTIIVTSRDYWPLPWYLRDYNYVGYPGRVVPPDQRIIVASERQEHELLPLLADNYRRVGAYRLRPAVTLVLYVRAGD